MRSMQSQKSSLHIDRQGPGQKPGGHAKSNLGRCGRRVNNVEYGARVSHNACLDSERITLLTSHCALISKNTRDLMTRVADLERRLSNIQDAPARDVFKATALHQRRDSTSRSAIRDDDAASPDTTRLQRVLETNGQSFMGEFSLSPGFDGPDKAKGISGYSSPDATLVPHEFGSLDLGMPASNRDRSSRKVRGWFESVLEEHGVVADEAEWRKYMHLFFDEIHVLYPILHPPSVWEVFEQLWEYSALWSMADVAERARKRRSAALVCFCLALGRCCVSTRMTDSTGVHSSGWSLYSVGVSLIDDSSKTGSTAATSLLSLQLLLLKVCVSCGRLPRLLTPTANINCFPPSSSISSD